MSRQLTEPCMVALRTVQERDGDLPTDTADRWVMLPQTALGTVNTLARYNLVTLGERRYGVSVVRLTDLGRAWVSDEPRQDPYPIIKFRFSGPLVYFHNDSSVGPNAVCAGNAWHTPLLRWNGQQQHVVPLSPGWSGYARHRYDNTISIQQIHGRVIVFQNGKEYPGEWID